MKASDSPERRIKFGCTWALALLLVIIPIAYVESGWSPMTFVLIGLAVFAIVILVLVNLPQR
jgi:hypothetical protein